jgi:hypothetical protein
MSMADLGSLGEFVASIAVLITLLFLALQMRRSTAEIKLRNDMDRSGSTVQAALMGANAVEAYTKSLRHPSDLTEDEVMQVWAYLDVFMAGALSTWSAYKRGLAGSDEWLSAKANVHYALSPSRLIRERLLSRSLTILRSGRFAWAR